MNKKSIALGLGLAFYSLFSVFAHAAAPNLFTYQGRLKESGQAITGNRAVEIFLCNAGTAGTCTTTGAQPVAVSNGLFRSTFTIPSEVNFGTGSWWLEIKVGLDTLAPRERLTSNAYALFAATAAYAENIAAAAGSDGVYVSSNLFVTEGQVGASRLQLAGGVLISSEAAPGLGAGLNISSNVYIVGFSSAARYYGDGSALTGVTASNIADGSVTDVKIVGMASSKLSGALPAIDGSALTGITATSYTGTLPLGNGGTGATTAADARTSLGLVIGTDVLAPTGNGSGLSGLTAAQVSSGKFTDEMLSISTGAFPGGFNAASQLVALDGAGKLPAVEGSALTGVITSTEAIVAALAGKVGTTGDESIGGYKTFSGTVDAGNLCIGGNCKGSWPFTPGSQVLNMGDYAVNASSHISAAAFQINGSTALAASAALQTVAAGIGAGALNGGSANTFVGYFAGYFNTTGADNTFLGRGAGWYNITGGQNVFVGKDSGIDNESGSANVVLGYEAASVSAVVSSSTILGYRAGFNLDTGNDNILIGFQAGDNLMTGGRNIIIGYDQDATASTISNELNIGGLLRGNLGAGTIGIGFLNTLPLAALDVRSTGTLVNQYAQVWRASDGVVVASMTATGKLWTAVAAAGDNLGNHTATQVLQMGAYGVNSSSAVNAGYFQVNASTMLALTPGGSLAVGQSAGLNSAGSNNIFVGYNTGFNTSGAANSFLGGGAGYTNTSGYSNVFLGWETGYFNTTGASNVLIGAQSGEFNETGAANVFSGYRSGGYGAGPGQSISSSTILGYQAGYNLRTGSQGNIFLGYQAGYNVTTGTGNIIIGFEKNAPAADTNSHLNIGGALFGDLITGKIGIGTNSPDSTLEVSGNVKLARYHVEAADTGKSLTGNDFGKTFTVNNVAAQTITLPTVGSGDIGAQITVAKLGAGQVTIDAPAGNFIADSTDGGTIYNNTAETYATITLRLVTADRWAIVGGNGSWTTN